MRIKALSPGPNQSRGAWRPPPLLVSAGRWRVELTEHPLSDARPGRPAVARTAARAQRQGGYHQSAYNDQAKAVHGSQHTVAPRMILGDSAVAAGSVRSDVPAGRHFTDARDDDDRAQSTAGTSVDCGYLLSKTATGQASHAQVGRSRPRASVAMGAHMGGPAVRGSYLRSASRHQRIGASNGCRLSRGGRGAPALFLNPTGWMARDRGTPRERTRTRLEIVE